MCVLYTQPRPQLRCWEIKKKTTQSMFVWSTHPTLGPHAHTTPVLSRRTNSSRKAGRPWIQSGRKIYIPEHQIIARPSEINRFNFPCQLRPMHRPSPNMACLNMDHTALTLKTHDSTNSSLVLYITRCSLSIGDNVNVGNKE